MEEKDYGTYIESDRHNQGLIESKVHGNQHGENGAEDGSCSIDTPSPGD
jgi:hypothetical protein